MTIQEKQILYHRLCHAVQTGVAMMLERRPNGDTTPKHLRVGVNIAMCEAAGMSRLLVRKGVITEDEYWDAMIEVMREEVARYKAEVNEAVGARPGLEIKLDGF
jgi:hypothetical protein